MPTGAAASAEHPLGISAWLPSSAPTSHRGADPKTLGDGHDGVVWVAVVVDGLDKLEVAVVVVVVAEWL